MKIWGRMIRFVYPPKSHILIIDGVRSQQIQDMVLNDMASIVLRTRLEEFFIAPGLLWLMLKYFWVGRNSGVEFSSWRGRLFFAYLCACVHLISPQVAVTYIDNYYYYGMLSVVFPDIVFIYIQNAMRVPFPECLPEKKFFLDNFFCFGQLEMDLYERLGYEVRHYYPVGSLTAGWYAVKDKLPARYDICLISMSDMTGDDFVTPLMKVFKRSNDLLYPLLAEYCRTTGKKLAVALRGNACREFTFYRDIFGDTAELIPLDTEKNPFSSYDTAMQSRLLVGVFSTIYMEALGLGKKVLFCNFTGEATGDIYAGIYPELSRDPLLYCRDATNFSYHIEQLLAVEDDSYMQYTLPYRSYCMNISEERPAHAAIREFIKEKTSQE